MASRLKAAMEGDPAGEHEKMTKYERQAVRDFKPGRVRRRLLKIAGKSKDPKLELARLTKHRQRFGFKVGKLADDGMYFRMEGLELVKARVSFVP
jgi:hypothetical protein